MTTLGAWADGCGTASLFLSLVSGQGVGAGMLWCKQKNDICPSCKLLVANHTN